MYVSAHDPWELNNATICPFLPYRSPRYSRHQWEGRQGWGARQWGTSGTSRSVWSNWCTWPQWRRADLRPLGEDHLPYSAGDRAGLRWTHSRELAWPHQGRGKLHLCSEGCRVPSRGHHNKQRVLLPLRSWVSNSGWPGFRWSRQLNHSMCSVWGLHSFKAPQVPGTYQCPTGWTQEYSGWL